MHSKTESAVTDDCSDEERELRLITALAATSGWGFLGGIQKRFFGRRFRKIDLKTLSNDSSKKDFQLEQKADRREGLSK